MIDIRGKINHMSVVAEAVERLSVCRPTICLYPFMYMREICWIGRRLTYVAHSPSRYRLHHRIRSEIAIIIEDYVD